MYTLEGVSSVANFITAYEEFLIRNVFLVPKSNLFDVYVFTFFKKCGSYIERENTYTTLYLVAG